MLRGGSDHEKKFICLHCHVAGIKYCSLHSSTDSRTTGTCGYRQAIDVDEEKAFNLLGFKNVGDRLSYEGKTELTYYFEILHRINNSTGICPQNTVYNKLDCLYVSDIAEMLWAANGIEMTKFDLEEIAMRQLNLEKALNARITKFSRKEDLPTLRDRSEALNKG